MNKLLTNIYHFFFFLIRPNYWFMNYPYSQEWDEEIKELSEKSITEIERYSCRMGEVLIWIENHPYASFTPYSCNFRPSRMTIYKLHKKLIKSQIENIINKL